MATSLNVGDTMQISYIRNGEPRVLRIKLTQSRNDLSVPSLTATTILFSIVAPMFMFFIAMIVLVRRPRNKVSVLFFMMSTCIAFYLLTSSSINISIPWWHALWPSLFYVNTIAFILFFPVLLHFFLVFPIERTIRGSRALRDVLVYGPYIVYIIIAMVLTDPTEMRESSHWLSISEFLLLVFSPLVSIFAVIRSYRKATSSSTRKAMKITLWGLGVFALASAFLLSYGFFYSSLNFSRDLDLILRICSLLALTFSLPIAFGYAIFRYGFMDVHIIFKRTAVYAVIAILTAMLFTGLYFVLVPYMRMFNTTELVFLIVMITGLVAIGVSALRDRIQRAVDHTLFRKEFRVAQELREFSRTLLNYLDRSSLLEALVEKLPGILRLHGTSVVQVDSDGGLRTLAGPGVPEAFVQKLLHINAFRETIANEDVVHVSQLRDVPHHRDVTTILPLSVTDGEYLLVVLGEKESGRPLTTEEQTLLQAVCDHAVVGWRNASLAEEMRENERIKKEVEIAHTIQSAMLPRTIPHFDGLDIHAVSCPAREVGGDFYDLMQLSPDELAIVAGDVSDKGVSAAMVMASAISTVRFAAEELKTPRDVVARSNERLFTDTRRHMFVALFFGVMNVKSRTLAFTNAGLPKPLLHRDGECYLLDWSENGGHLALGMKTEVVFHEQTLELMPGDILVLYTDGVVESCDIHEEEFGVKRLRDIVHEAADKDAEGIVQSITHGIQSFRGRQDLFDDLTVVVVKMTGVSE
jgi:serine phosphatase RsbU (regulator of sigma subunit)